MTPFTPTQSSPRQSLPSTNWMKPRHRKLLAAAVDRILPGDDGPGSLACGVHEYIEVALEDPWHSHLQPLFREGLEFFDGLAIRESKVSFLELSPEGRDQIMQQAQTYPNNDARRFFEHLVQLTLEGFLSDPAHGGNRNGVGWEYVGFDNRSDEEMCLGTEALR